MSRTRLIASMTVISCSLALIIALAALVFPLKAAPRFPQNPPEGTVAGGVSGGVQGGMPEGVSSPAPEKGTRGGIGGGIIDGISGSESQSVPDVDYSTIWIDTVKRGTMFRQVRGVGSLVRAENSTNLVARIIVPAEMMLEVRFDQNATVDTRKGLVKGHVIALKAADSDENRAVYIGLDGRLPEGAVADLPVEGSIDIEKIENTLYIGRPANVPANSTPFASASEFKIVNEGKDAERVVVKLGKPSANTIQVLGGLEAGDKIILSDMSEYDSANRIHLTDERHLLKH